MRSVTHLGLLGILLCTTASVDAATITGTVTGPDGKPFRAAFVQARNAGLEDDGQRAVRQSGPLHRREPAGRRLPRCSPGDRLQGRPEDRHEAHRRPERVRTTSRCRPPRSAGPRFPSCRASSSCPTLRGKDDAVRELHGLPRLPVPDGGGGARRGRLARPRQLHARGDALLARRSPRLQRPAGRGRRLLSEPRLQRGLAAAEVAGRPAAPTRTPCSSPPTRRSRSSTWTTRCRVPTGSRGPRTATRTASAGRRNTGRPTRSCGSIRRPAR